LGFKEGFKLLTGPYWIIWLKLPLLGYKERKGLRRLLLFLRKEGYWEEGF